MQELFPGTRLGIGPPVENGFYYDFDPERPFTPEDLAALEKKMTEIVRAGQHFSRREISDADAQAELAGAAGKETAEYPVFPEYGDDVYYSVASVATDALSEALTIAGKNERNDRTDEIKVEVLSRLAEQYAGRVDVIGIDFQETSRAAARELLRRTGVSYPVYSDPDGGLRAIGLPKVVMIDAEGQIAFEQYLEIDSPEQLAELAEEHLGVAP